MVGISTGSVTSNVNEVAGYLQAASIEMIRIRVANTRNEEIGHISRCKELLLKAKPALEKAIENINQVIINLYK